MRIDVALNEDFDGSYVGKPLDLASHVGFCFGREGPKKRLPFTQVLVVRYSNTHPPPVLSIVYKLYIYRSIFNFYN